MENLSKSQISIKKAYDKGYRIINGECFSPRGKGKFINGCIKLHPVPYRQLSLHDPKGAISIPYHALLAYQLYGDEYFKEGMVARHKDGNSLNNSDDNIILGTQQDNSHDIDGNTRKQRVREGNRTKAKLTSELKKQIKEDYLNGMGAKQLYKKYNTCLNTMYILIRKNFK